MSLLPQSCICRYDFITGRCGCKSWASFDEIPRALLRKEHQRRRHEQPGVGVAVIERKIKGLFHTAYKIERFDLTLPQNPEFAQRDLCEDLTAKTAAVEGVKK